MPASFANQSSDSENDKAPRTSTPAEDDVKTVKSESAQSIAQDRKNLGGLDGESKKSG